MMDTYVDERDYRLLEADKYTFFVLKRIIGGECRLLFSDHERLILCFSAPPYPVWIWTPDDAPVEEMERAYQLVRENELLTGDYQFNCKYSLAQYFMQRASEDGFNAEISTNLYAYDCLDPIAPKEKAEGVVYRCEMKDLEEVVELMDLFHKEVGIDQRDLLSYRADAKAYIQSGNLFFWKDPQGNHVASCKYTPNGEMASISLVYTRPEFRRKHYGENLVYQVTMKAKEAGYVPMLYSDADYAASNACYQKVGYILRGKLCTISIQ